jgi:hypothetical protein
MKEQDIVHLRRLLPPSLILKHRAEARAILFRTYCAYVDLEEAIAPLRQWALDHGLVDTIGAAESMRIIYAAFDLPPDGTVPPNHRYIEPIS